MANVKLVEYNPSFAHFINDELRRQCVTARCLASMCHFDNAAFYVLKKA